MSAVGRDSRRCGNLEAWSVHRTNLDVYQNVVLAMLYSPRDSQIAFYRRLRTSLRDLIHKHALLQCYVSNPRSDSPCFTRTAIPRLANLPLYIDDEVVDNDSPKIIDGIVQDEHTRACKNEELWRVRVVPTNAGDYWIVFAFNHAIGDGTAGLIMHYDLLHILGQTSSRSSTNEPEWDEDLENIPLTESEIDSELDFGIAEIPPCIEHPSMGLDFTVSLKTLVNCFLPSILPTFLMNLFGLNPTYWLGNPTTRTMRRAASSGTKLSSITLSTSEVHALRVFSKHHKVTVHALLHASVLHAVPTTMPLKSSTPVSLRPFVPENYRSQVLNLATAYTTTTCPRSTLLETAKEFYEEINLVSSKQSIKEQIGLLAYIPKNDSEDSSETPCKGESFILNRMFQQEGHSSCCQSSFEISNLGVWIPPSTASQPLDQVSQDASSLAAVTVKDVLFSGSNSSIGEVFDACVVTLPGRDGLMRIAFTWKQTYVDEGTVQNIIRAFKENILSFVTSANTL